MMKNTYSTILFTLLLLSSISTPASAASNVDLDRLDEAASQDAIDLAPVFLFTRVGCLPSPAISNTGVQNGGLKASGSQTGGCQRPAQLMPTDSKSGSNTYYRKQCVAEGASNYCAHMYALYFMKDQTNQGIGGHRHEWEYSIIWTTNGAMTHGAHSYQNTVKLSEASNLTLGGANNKHPIFVYDQIGKTTHAMYFYPRETNNKIYNQTPVTPTIVDWHQMKGHGQITNELLRYKFNAYDYEAARCSFNDNNFVSQITKAIPPGYPKKEKWTAQ